MMKLSVSNGAIIALASLGLSCRGTHEESRLSDIAQQFKELNGHIEGVSNIQKSMPEQTGAGVPFDLSNTTIPMSIVESENGLSLRVDLQTWRVDSTNLPKLESHIRDLARTAIKELAEAYPLIYLEYRKSVGCDFDVVIGEVDRDYPDDNSGAVVIEARQAFQAGATLFDAWKKDMKNFDSEPAARAAATIALRSVRSLKYLADICLLRVRLTIESVDGEGQVVTLDGAFVSIPDISAGEKYDAADLAQVLVDYTNSTGFQEILKFSGKRAENGEQEAIEYFTTLSKLAEDVSDIHLITSSWRDQKNQDLLKNQ